MITVITLKDLKPVLLDPKGGGLKEPYFIIHSKETEENITVLLQGSNGHEFNKTFGYVHQYPGVLIYRCIYGQGLILIQKNDLENQAKEIRVASIHPGVEVEVPVGYAHCMINTGKSYLITVDNSPNAKSRNFVPIQERQGLNYYVIDKKGEIGFEKNTNYSYHPYLSNY